MSKKIADETSNIEEIGRILPPKIEFTSFTPSFSGTAKPGLKINLSSSVDGQDACVTVGKNGTWKMPVAADLRPYTVFKIWASDDETGAESDKIQFTFGGRNPKLDDAYISEKVAFGFATPGSDIAIYASSGKQIGLAQAAFDQPFWRVRFTVANRPKAGDTLCVIVKNPNGNTSMPHFTTARTFSIDHIGTNEYRGSGAVPGEVIQLLDHDSSALLDAAKVSDDGTWAITFANELDFGQRVKLQIIHEDGSISDGPYTSTATTYGLAPSISAFKDGQIWGFALPGTQVVVNLRYQGWTKLTLYPVADGNGQWYASFQANAIQPGYTAWAWANGTKMNCAIYQPSTLTQIKPLPPLSRPAALEYDPTFNKFTTWVSLQDAVSIQTKEGFLYGAASDAATGQFVPPNLSYLGVEEGEVVFFGTTNSPVAFQQDVPTSIYTGMVNQTNPYTVPEPPTITTCEPEEFAGTEPTPETVIDIFDESQSDEALNFPVIPVNNGLWTSVNQSPPITFPLPAEDGDLVAARATSISLSDLGATRWSGNYTVGNPGSNLNVPIPPEISNNRYNNIWGQSMANTFVTVNMYPFDWQQGQPGTSVGTTGAVTIDSTELNWQLLVDKSKGQNGPGQPSGTTYEAYASFADSSNHSDSYYSQIGTSSLGHPVLTYVAGSQCQGTAPAPQMTIYGWRSSDGKQIVNYQMPYNENDPDTDVPFTADYVPNEHLSDSDLLNVVAAYGGPHPHMSPFDRKPYGWGM